MSEPAAIAKPSSVYCPSAISCRYVVDRLTLSAPPSARFLDVFEQAALGASAGPHLPISAAVPGMFDQDFFPDAVHELVTGITVNAVVPVQYPA